jgi:hypothetical protein
MFYIICREINEQYLHVKCVVNYKKHVQFNNLTGFYNVIESNQLRYKCLAACQLAVLIL